MTSRRFDPLLSHKNLTYSFTHGFTKAHTPEHLPSSIGLGFLNPTYHKGLNEMGAATARGSTDQWNQNNSLHGGAHRKRGLLTTVLMSPKGPLIGMGADDFPCRGILDFIEDLWFGC